MANTSEKIVLDPTTQHNVDLWLNGNYDAETKEQIRKLLKENPKEIVDAFYTNLKFGTGGLRGIMGVGTNRMNRYTVGAATQGLANYLKMQPKPPTGQYTVLIGYDSRNNSRSFAEETAKVFAGNGIKVYLFKNIRPVGLVSFGCRLKKCSAAVMITASHNPPQYNGYKVYWSDGAQVLPPHDQGIIDEAEKITDVSQIKMVNSITDSLIEFVDGEIDEPYLKDIVPLQCYPEQNHKYGPTLSVVYTSLHGTGITMIPRALPAWGFTQIHYVEQQIIPDGNFPTAPSPNPEEKSALKLGMELLKKVNGDILIANDPDADRVGVVVNHHGEQVILTGNQTACICLEHLCEALTKLKRMPEKAAFVKTIATTEMFKTIVTAYKKQCFDVLTGFKYIAQLINEWEAEPNGNKYVFGGEESYGYLLGTLSRDKDAILSSDLICEVALNAKLQGKTMADLLHDLYIKYGVFVDKLLSLKFEESKEGKEKMAKGFAQLQKDPPTSINGIDVVALEDYDNSVKTFLKNGTTEPLELPKSNCLLFWLADESKLLIRPSGTEPKIKIYCGVVRKKFDSVEEALKEGDIHADSLVKALKQHLDF